MHRPGLLLLIFVTCCFGEISAQQLTKIDSLRSIIASLPDNKEKADALIQMAEEYLNVDPDRALEYSDQLTNLSENLNYSTGIIEGYSLRGRIYRNENNWDSAVLFTNLAINYADSVEEYSLKARMLTEKGYTCYFGVGLREALDSYMASYDTYSQLSDSAGMTTSLNGIGALYSALAKYDSAVYYLIELCKIAERLQYEGVLGKGYLNLGIAYLDLEQYDYSRSYLIKSIEINEKLGETQFLGTAHLNLGNVAYENDSLNMAYDEYIEALSFYENNDYSRGIAHVYLSLGNVHEKWERYQEAYDYYSKAKDIYDDIKDVENYIRAYKNIGVVYEAWEDYDKAIGIFSECLEMSEEGSYLFLQEEINENLAISHYLYRKYKNAYDYLWVTKTLEDSIFTIKRQEKISDLELKYEKEKNQVTILSQQNEILAKDRDLKIRTFVGASIIALALFLFLYLRQKAVKNRIISEQRIRQLEEEKKVLQAKALVEGQDEERKRIARELHDGLGVLLSTVKMQFTTLKDKSPENKPLIDRASQLLEQASTDVRKISHNMMPGLLTKLGLFEAVEDLMEKVGETEGLDAFVEVPEDAERLPENKEIMLYRIIQEMVNNTLKYAEAKRISVRLQMFPGKMDVYFSDDGVGFNVEEKLESKSIGLQSIHSRVNFLNGSLEIDSKPGEGTSYQISIPI